jgi:hypothetical protein
MKTGLELGYRSSNLEQTNQLDLAVVERSNLDDTEADGNCNKEQTILVQDWTKHKKRYEN